jgi:hypothetical protein
MSNELVNADFSRRVVIATDEMPWVPSPQAGVERRLLDRIGGEVARATSLVRYEPASAFPAHDHALGEEFLVLSGVFSDEHGDYPTGTYVRNPPRSRHTPRTAPGCTILVKLRQMALSEQTRIVVDSTTARWEQASIAGLKTLPLYLAPDAGEKVMLERLEAGTKHGEVDCPMVRRYLYCRATSGMNTGRTGPGHGSGTRWVSGAISGQEAERHIG